MGLFSFVKSVGAKIGIGSEEAAPEPAELVAEAAKHELNVAGLDVAVDGDKVTISGGEGVSQEEKEKIILAMGNVTGVATVEEAIVTNEDAPESKFHEVKKGDTLWAIASETMGNGSKYTEIFEANRPMLSDPDKIYPGQILRIPA